MSGTVRIVIGIVVFAILIGVGLYLYFASSGPEEPAVEQAAVEQPIPPPTPTLQDRLSERLKGITLEGSDEAVRELVGALSADPKLASWLVNEDLVRRFVAAVHNVADGKSPRAHLEFLSPSKGFTAVERRGSTVADPGSFTRYDLVTTVFTSLDNDGVARLFAELEPLIDEAHREIAPPDTSFRTVLVRAIDRLLAVTPPSGEEALELKVLTYTYADESLEGLPEAERHLLRFGPKNAAEVQGKLRELRQALGL